MSGTGFSEPPPSETADLAARAQEGSAEAFGDLFRRVAPTVFVYACARVGWTWEDAEDVVSEVWMRARAKLADWDPARPFRPWILGFAFRVVKEVQKRAANRLAEGGTDSARLFDPERFPDEATEVSRDVARHEELREFVAWMRGLSRYEREVLLLRGVEGWSFDEVAAGLGRTRDGVKRCWERLMVKIRERGETLSLISD